jgi:hypothetical protein
MGVEEYVRDYSCDAGATRRRVERVCHDIEKLIGPDARGVTVEVDGSRCGEIKARLGELEKRGIIIINKGAARTVAPAPVSGAETTVDGRVVVKRNGAVV